MVVLAVGSVVSAARLFFFGFDDDEMVHPNEITAVLGLGTVQIVQPRTARALVLPGFVLSRASLRDAATSFRQSLTLTLSLPGKPGTPWQQRVGLSSWQTHSR